MLETATERGASLNDVASLEAVPGLVNGLHEVVDFGVGLGACHGGDLVPDGVVEGVQVRGVRKGTPYSLMKALAALAI